MKLGRHPGYASLNRFADGELSPRRHRRVASHLAGCSRCRQEVAFIRHAGKLARSLEPPTMPDDILDRILEARADGSRVLLPLESPGPRPRRSIARTAVPAIAAVLTLLVVGLFASTRFLQADKPDLRIAPERPRAGATLAIEYDGGQQFAAEEYLKLRARYRTATGQHWQQIAGILARDEEVFRAEVVLPDSVVYAAFAVETLDMQHVDSRNRELWEVLIHTEDDQPALAALGERAADLIARNELEALRTARTITELYPESARGWAWRWAVESPVAEGDSARDWHHARLRECELTMAEEPPSDPEELAHVAWYAIQLGDWASADFWTREAERRGASSAYLYQAKAVQLQVANRPGPEAALPELEALWQLLTHPVGAVADAGWFLSLEAGDWQAATRWLPRYLRARGLVRSTDFLEQLEQTFGPERTLEWALAHREDVLLGRSNPRPLIQPLDEHQRYLAQRRQRTLAALARIAANTGRRSVAAGLAVEALPLAWETTALETLGAVLLEVGDTANAITAYARAVADPLGHVPPQLVARAPDWNEALEAARYALTRYVLQGSVIRHLPGDLRREGQLAVTAFASVCDNSFEELNELASRLDSISFTVYAMPSPLGGPVSLRACGLEVPIDLDSTGRVGQAFRVRGMPTYFITDAQGRIRFEHSALEQIPRQLQALRQTTRPAVAD